MQEKEAKKQCRAVFKSGKRRRQQCTVMCLPTIEERFLRHNATSVDAVPFDVHPIFPMHRRMNTQTVIPVKDEADSFIDEQCTDISLEVNYSCMLSSPINILNMLLIVLLVRVIVCDVI